MSWYDLLLAKKLCNGEVVIVSDGITCTDDGEANITITEDNNNG